MNRRVKFYKSKDLVYYLGKVDEKCIMNREFKMALERSVLERVNRSFIKTYKPIMDDAPYRVFSKIQDYKNWCEKYLPSWLGYGKAK